ncbi:hypothetical protein ACP70R_016708 [Stipagrostis hirtigluma subsp. patula]
MAPFLLRWKRLPPERKRRRHIAFKRRRRPELRIDHLPQDIVERIVSFLPMKDAARTSVLSSKWQQGWASYPKLTLNSETMLGASKCKVDYARKFESEQYRLKFIKNVNTIMRQHHGFGVEEFVLQFRLVHRDAQHLDSWLALAATARLERLAIDLSGSSMHCDTYPEEYAFSLQLLENKGGTAHLRILQLTKLSLKPLGDFRGFVNLSALELKLVWVTQDDLQSLLCKCPCLERLVLNSCGDFACLHIGHHLHRLEHLSIDGGTLVDNLRIDAMNLRAFSHGYNIGEIIVREDCQIREVTADMNVPPCDYFRGIYYKDTLQYMFTGLPSALPCLEKLSLNILEDIKVYNRRAKMLEQVHASKASDLEHVPQH